MKIVIGMVGEKGSGKDTFAEILKGIASVPVERCKSSDLLGETLDVWKLPRTRHNLQHLAIVMDQGFGIGTLTNALYARMESCGSDIVIFDAVRWQSDAKMIRSFQKNFLVYVTATTATRYQRIKARKQKMGEATATFEQFLKEEQISTETEIPVIGANADCIITNEGDVKEFKKHVLKFYQQKIAPIL